MRKTTIGLLLAGALLAAPSVSAAGPYGDELSKCLVERASSADQTALVRWLFSALSTHPSLTDMGALTPAQRDAASKAVADSFGRLLLKDCRPQALKALKYEGDTAMEQAFQVFGQVAARDLMTAPAPQAELGRLEKFIDMKGFEALGVEAGAAAAK